MDLSLTTTDSLTDTTTATKTEIKPETKAADPAPLETELTYLVDFILDRTQAPSLGRHVAAHIEEVAADHAPWSRDCRWGGGHMYDDLPCGEYERALSLGIAWMKDYVLTLEDRLKV
ncbi:hypothetical protein [Nocardioides sp. J54]|uniref:hypothetical protein n=1 Tax=Nocardioides sp. J54 TaxID=935866 RepID=UPI00048D060A|nr:hypothetical protein [Nocardioides sp. J54]